MRCHICGKCFRKGLLMNDFWICLECIDFIRSVQNLVELKKPECAEDLGFFDVVDHREDIG